MYYFLCKLITDLQNSIHFFIHHWTKSYAQKFGSAKKL